MRIAWRSCIAKSVNSHSYRTLQNQRRVSAGQFREGLQSPTLYANVQTEVQSTVRESSEVGNEQDREDSGVQTMKMRPSTENHCQSTVLTIQLAQRQATGTQAGIKAAEGYEASTDEKRHH